MTAPLCFDLPDRPLKLTPGRMVSLDFETFSKVNIKKAGSWRYALDPSTEVLLLSWTVDEGRTVHRWKEGDPPPLELFTYIARGFMLRAWNSEFERAIWDHVCVPTLGWDPVPFEQWCDSAALARIHALPGALDKCGKALGLEVEKDKNGTRLINKFSKPRKPTKKDPSTRNRLADHPEDAEKFMSYCDDDVRLECAIFDALPHKRFRVGEDRVWRQTCRMNEQGIHLDVDSFQAIRSMLSWWRELRTEQLRELTNGEVQTDGQRDKAMEWLSECGVDLDSYTKDDIAKALQDPEIDPDAREFLLIRQELSQVSTKKFEAMANVVWKGRSHNNMVYHRATTGRNGGAGLQLHNFPRDALSKSNRVIEDCLDYIRSGNYEAAIAIYGGTPFDIAKQLLRSMIVPPPGEIFYCADFSSVENIVTVWICQDPVGLDVFENGEDQYRAFAAKQFGIPASEVSDVIRTESKATILGAMFGAGWKTIYATNQQKGIPMTEQQAKQNVKEFRRQYKVTSDSWYELKDCIIDAVEKPGKSIKYKGLIFQVKDGYLWIRLHSGRYLAYYAPENRWVKAPWGEDIYTTTIMAENAKSQWVRQNMTPSKIIENIVQAVARDLLMNSQETLYQRGLRILLNVHDEILSSQRPGFISLEEFVKLMVIQPDWTKALPRPLPLKAEGYLARRYRK
jgi:DNA polymerase